MDNTDANSRRAVILQALRERQSQAATSRTGIPRRETPSRSSPLSFAQERLWFLERLEDMGSTYHVGRAMRLSGSLNEGALQRALEAMCARHESLRTGIEMDDGKPVQIVSPDPDPHFLATDLRALSDDERPARLRELVDLALGEPFDLDSAGLLRCRLMRCGDREHVLVVVLHHLVTDGWSMDLFFRDFEALYAAEISGSIAELPDLPIQFGDYSAWQRRTLCGEKLDELMGYWRSVLGDLPEPLDLPTDFVRGPATDHHGGTAGLEMSNEELEPIRRLCRQASCTFSMGLLAVFNVLMARCSGCEDIAVGTAVANRGHSELEHMIGFLINTVVLRTDLAGAPSFRELLGRVRETALGAYSHQDMPFEKLVEELNPPRDASRNPLFQVFFNHYATTSRQDNRFGDLESESFDTKRDRASSKFDLTLYLMESREKIRLRLVYRSDLFRRERVEEMLRQFRYLVGQVAAEPDLSIRELSLITPESRRLLPDPRAPIPEPAQIPVSELVRGWGVRAADHPAVNQGARNWSYGELCGHSAALARELGDRGIGHGDVVAIHGPRSFGFVVSMLAVLQSGGVMLLLDPDLPAERKRAMMDRTVTRAMIRVAGAPTDDDSLVSGEPGVPVIDVPRDGDDPLRDDGPAPQSAPTVSLDQPAYIFFTSGTTGIPKGVTGTHKGLSHFIRWQGETFGINPSDRAAQLTAQSFDVVLRDILTPLAHGATLCLPRTPGRLDAKSFWQWLRKAEITLVHTVPSLAETWLTHVDSRVSVPSLRWVFFAGEPLTATLVRRWRQVCANTSVVNLYGPTETTMAKCYHVVDEVPPDGVQPIGRPLPDTQALVLSRSGRQCGVGETGEIAIRTPFRTLGYIGAEQREDRRFASNPSRDDADDVLFHTGDVGRYRPDGSLEILGRLDEQVKIRGVRIELPEVSDALSGHPEVDACHVAVTKDARGEQRLVAYVVLGDAARTSSEGLRAALRRTLPPVMVPSAILTLEQLPLTANGKIDRARLPAVKLDWFDREHGFVAPSGLVETELAVIWKDVLRLERVGVLDNFFDLGGHSMLAIELFARIEQAFGRSLPLSVLYHAGTIRELALEIGSGAAPDRWSCIVPIQANGERRPLFLIHGVAGNVIFYRSLADRLGTDQPVYGLQPETVDGRLPAERTLEAMAGRYIAEMRRIQPLGPFRLGGFSFGGLVAYEMARQLVAAGESVETLVVFDTRSGVRRDAVKSAGATPSRPGKKRAFKPALREFLRQARRNIPWSQERSRAGAKGLVTNFLGRRVPVDARPEFTAWYCSRLARAYRMEPCQTSVVYFSTQPRGEAEILAHWEKSALGGLHVHRVSGKHKEGLFDEPNVSDVAKALESYLRPSGPDSAPARRAMRDSSPDDRELEDELAG